MSECQSMTVKTMVRHIKSGKMILPAMQRSFVWPEEKIYHLFDSLMRDYPIGTCLFWDFEKDICDQFAFNKFISEVDDQKQKMQRGESVSLDRTDYTAVLDGQQRLTSLFIGCDGKWRTHIRGKKYDDKESYFDRYLCIDILNPPSGEAPYPFSFIAENEIGLSNDNKHYWHKVSEFIEDGFDATTFVLNFEEEHPEVIKPGHMKAVSMMLNTLCNALTTKSVLYYYLSEEKSLAKVVDIFVRVNSGGQKLSASDLMLSVASGAQGDEDIHVKMKDAIDAIGSSVVSTTGLTTSNNDGIFKVDNDFILTAGLLFTGAKSLSLQKQENYAKDIIRKIFIDEWDRIVNALCIAVKLVGYIGFNVKKLTGKNILLPIGYYIYKNGITESNIRSEANLHHCNRIFIKQWMLRCMIKSVFAEGIGVSLLKMRAIIDLAKHKYFPLDDFMKTTIKHDLIIDSERIEELLDSEYGSLLVYPVLVEVTGYKDLDYHVDHIWAKELMKSGKAVKKFYPAANPETINFYKDNYNKLPNLQMLQSNKNMSKWEKPYEKWLEETHPNAPYFEDNCIPTGDDNLYKFNYFEEFFTARKELLKKRLEEAFPSTFDDVVKKWNLKI